MSNSSGKVLSISIASYNVESTIGKAIESLIADETVLDKLEIIVVNDGSSDRTSEIAHNYQIKHPESIIVIDKENGGYGSTINSSLQIATGKYYKLLDGDDWYDSDSLKSFITFLSESDSDIVISPYYEIHNDEKVLDDFHKEIPNIQTSFDSVEFKSSLFAMHEIAVNTEILRATGIKITEKCFYTDTEYNALCFLNSHTISRFDIPVYCYRLDVNGQSMSLSGVRKHYKDLITVTSSVINIFRNYNSSNNNIYFVLKRYVTHIIFAASCGLMVLEDIKQSKALLIEYDKMLQSQYSEEYKISNDSGFLRLMRFFKFFPYRVFRKYAMTKFC